HFLQSKDEFPEDNCTLYKCSLNIPVPAEGSTYCVSAKGSLYGDLMIGASSEESCIDVPLKQTSTLGNTIIQLKIYPTLFFICILENTFKKKKSEDSKQPEGIVIRNLNTDSIPESKSEVKYLSVISIMPGQSVWPTNDAVTSLEAEPKEETLGPKNSSEGASSVHPPEAPAKAEEVSVQESTEEVSSDDEQNHKVKESYFTSDSNQMDICSNSSGTEVSATEIQQAVIPSSCLKFPGYDKPHVPLDMLIDVGEEQPVIAYRLTD
ncbi:Interferon gamma receptor 1, partial [Eudyptes chrysocome]